MSIFKSRLFFAMIFTSLATRMIAESGMWPGCALLFVASILIPVSPPTKDPR